MRRMQPIFGLSLIVISALLAGCSGGYGGYVEEDPEWDGGVYVGDGYGPGYYRDHGWHDNAFRGDGRHSAGEVSGRGHASLGGGGGGGGGRSGGGGHAGGGGHR
jgi:hypothetical protein